MQLCNVCGDHIPSEERPITDEIFGRVCTFCGARHLPRATVLLARAPGISGVLREPKNSRPKSSKPTQP